MKKFTTLLLSILFLSSSYSQCVADFDFGDASFGVSPDFSIGESLENGTINTDYYDVIHMLMPLYASDVDSTLPALELDSLELISITLIESSSPDVNYLPEELGLEIVCNNNGDSESPCSFLSGNQYCAAVVGIPNTVGSFECSLTILGWVGFFGNAISQEVSFDGITLEILEENTDNGCTDPLACNYSPDAIIDDGSCIYECLGCIDAEACNYDENADIDDGSCDYSCYGCTDSNANNFDAEATIDDGTCCFLELDYNSESALCYGGLGVITSITLGVQDGAVIEYTLNGETNNTGVFEVVAGFYTIDAVISEGCSASIDVIATHPQELEITATATDASILGDGVGTATVEGGTEPYEIVWLDSSNLEVDPDALGDGDYTVVVTDANGCEASTTVSVLWNSVNDFDITEFNLFPNPTTGNISIVSSTVIDNAIISIIDGIGQRVFSLNASHLSNGLNLELDGYNSGLYTVIIETSKGSTVKKLQLVK